MEGARMEELRGRVREGAKGPWDLPREPANELLDDLNKLRIMRISIGDGHGCNGRRYESYPESHHLEEEEER